MVVANQVCQFKCRICCTAVDDILHNHEVKASNPAGCLAFFILSFYLFNQVSLTWPGSLAEMKHTWFSFRNWMFRFMCCSCCPGIKPIQRWKILFSDIWLLWTKIKAIEKAKYFKKKEFNVHDKRKSWQIIFLSSLYGCCNEPLTEECELRHPLKMWELIIMFYRKKNSYILFLPKFFANTDCWREKEKYRDNVA